MSATTASVVLALVAAFLFACGSAAQQAEAAGVDEDGSLIAALVRRPRWWLGLLGDLGGYAFQAWALALGPVLVVQPLIVAALLFALPVSALLNHTRVTAREWAYAAVLAVALAVFLIAGRPSDGVPDAAGATWLPALLVVGAVAAAATGIGLVRALPGPARALSFGVASGVLFGVATVLTKPVLTSYEHAEFLANTLRLLTDWRLFVLILCGLGAMYLQQRAFQPAPISASLPAITLAEPVCAAALGAVVLGETVTMSGAHGVAVVASGVVGAVAAARLAGR
ncbi:DMT family transporter [Tsukamurella paurometabola]|uniref:DMT family transporter n=1 Tax=Tsukamurella paurometabola TaxID=2061 RepID=A0ABS5NFP1_TSUPA|nr:DMT family transporter [Tsukamurella paurometabola]MBS4102248.1 DMT family transporter [Tsukamurella paurometabola]